jgi:hypothetical protein
VTAGSAIVKRGVQRAIDGPHTLGFARRPGTTDTSGWLASAGMCIAAWMNIVILLTSLPGPCAAQLQHNLGAVAPDRCLGGGQLWSHCHPGPNGRLYWIIRVPRAGGHIGGLVPLVAWTGVPVGTPHNQMEGGSMAALGHPAPLQAVCIGRVSWQPYCGPLSQKPSGLQAELRDARG